MWNNATGRRRLVQVFGRMPPSILAASRTSSSSISGAKALLALVVEDTISTTTGSNQHHHNFSSSSSLSLGAAVDTIAENQIKAWQNKGGEDSLYNKGKKLVSDRHRYAANAFGVGHDYVHSKILADNNVKPESIQRRIDLDQEWGKLQVEIQNAYRNAQQQQQQQQQLSSKNRNNNMSPSDFAHSKMARELFQNVIQDLDEKAKKVNDAIISDSLRFNGRSPVRHARRFKLEERIMEALEDATVKQLP